MSALQEQVGGTHYKNMGIQPVEYILANKMDYLAGNVIKYISRYRLKGGATDVLKAMHYCQMILDSEYKDYEAS